MLLLKLVCAGSGRAVRHARQSGDYSETAGQFKTVGRHWFHIVQRVQVSRVPAIQRQQLRSRSRFAGTLQPIVMGLLSAYMSCVSATRTACVNVVDFNAPRSLLHVLQYVDEQNGYLCGYLKIKGLTEEFPNLTTYFDGEIINEKCPFLTRKWDADEEVDKKHWVCTC